MKVAGSTRPLTDEERRLSRWMLENAGPEARAYLGQLEVADATTWRSRCGCASFMFRVRGSAEAPPGIHILGDYVFGDDEERAGAFIYENEGILSGVEIYGLAGDAPAVLPGPEALRPWAGAVVSERDPPHDS